MNRHLRKLLAFGLTFLPLFLAFLALYVVVLPYYLPRVHDAANLITERLSPPTTLVPDEGGLWTAYLLPAKGERRFLVAWDGFHWLYVSLALLPALLLATPVPLVERLRLLGLGLLLLPVTHVLSVVALGRGYVCLAEEQGRFLCMWMLRAVYFSGQAMAMILWLALTRRHWLGRLRRSTRVTER